MKIFISYSSQNRDIVRALANDLQELISTLYPDSEFGVWFDKEIAPGHKWWDDILNAVEACDLFVFALSADALESDACKREIEYASVLRKRVLPVLILNDVNPLALPQDLQLLQYVDYRDRDTKAAHQNLLRGLTRLPAPLPPPVPLPPRPDPPVSPLSPIAHQIESPALDLQVQAGIVHELKQYLDQPKHSQQARELLARLAKHPDARASIVEEINTVLRSQEPSPPQPAIRPAAAPARVVVTPSRPASTPAAGRGIFKPTALRLAGAAVGAFAGFVLVGGLGGSYIDPYTGLLFSYGPDFEELLGGLLVCGALGWVGGIVLERLLGR